MTNDVASIQVWAKGFRVTERSEEFQLVIPHSTDQLADAERGFLVTDWGPLLQPLYRASDSQLGKQFIILLPIDNFCTVACATHSEDRHKRKSVVVVSATMTIDWADVASAANILAQARGLVLRLASHYAATFAEGLPHIQDQLRNGKFINGRQFALTGERMNDSVDWHNIANEIHLWKGVRGIGTTLLVALGANILFGSMDEVERVRGDSVQIDGLLDASSGRITAITSNIERWGQTEIIPGPSERSPEPASIEGLDKKLDRIIDSQQRLADLVWSLITGRHSK